MSFRRLLSITSSFVLALLSFSSVYVQAQNSGPCDDTYLKSLPLPSVVNHRVVQIVNCTDQVILGASNAAHRIKEPAYPVFPDEGTWVMQPFNPSNWSDHSNVLTLQIPTLWEATVGTKKDGANAPNIWARTGCRYDIKNNRAVCETGGCGDKYDCSAANLGPSGFTTITEWTFYQPTGKTFIDNPDISAVNGASLTVDIQAVNGDAANPNGLDWGWLRYNGHLANYGQDVRNPTYCGANTVSQGGFLLTRTDINKSNYLKYEIIDENANLACLKGQGTNDCNLQKTNNSLACLSNCGYYEFPTAQKPGCDQNDPKCVGWEVFCAGDPTLYPPKEFACSSDQDCVNWATQNGKPWVHDVCWINTPGANTGQCAQKAFYQSDISNCDTQIYTDPKTGQKSYWGAPTGGVSGQDWVIPCSFPYQSYNALTGMVDWSTQPPYGRCSEVQVNGQSIACVGDDQLHKAMYGAYTWPNDPEVYGGNASVYRVIYSPQSQSGTNLPITPSVPGFPLCSDMPDNYKYAQNQVNCGVPIQHEGAIFAAAVANVNADGKYISTGSDWSCSLFEPAAAVSLGATCRWQAPATDLNCDPPKLDSDVVQSACGKIDYGLSLVSSQITPTQGQPLFVQVSIPKVISPVQTPSVPTGCSSNWQLVAGGSLSLSNNEGYMAWYQATANTDQACQVTVTLADSNPAELKVYGLAGNYANAPIIATSFAGKFDYPSANAKDSLQYAPFAGQATLNPANEYLMLGSLMQVNRQYAPLTMWNNWLTNALLYPGVECVDPKGNADDNFCPTDDGADFLPGHGLYSSSADSGHLHLKGYSTNVLQRAGVTGGKFSWGGVAIYLQYTPPTQVAKLKK